MFYVYGIVDTRYFEPLPGAGHEAGDVVPIPSGRLAAVVSALSVCKIEATPQNVWCHERVLERLMPEHAVLPLRFGTTCRDADALEEYLLHSAGGLANDLERVRGKVEIALRIMEDTRQIELPQEALNDDGPAGRGAAYLRSRLQYHRCEMAQQDSSKWLENMLRQYFDPVAKDLICAAPADASTGFRVSCLVERDRVAVLADALDRFRSDHSNFDVTCTGPWAPYSFVAAPPVSMVEP